MAVLFVYYVNFLLKTIFSNHCVVYLKPIQNNIECNLKLKKKIFACSYLMNDLVGEEEVGGHTIMLIQWCGRLNNAPHKDVHILIHRTCKFVTLHCKRIFMDMRKLRISRWGDCSRLFGWTQCNYRSPYN